MNRIDLLHDCLMQSTLLHWGDDDGLGLALTLLYALATLALAYVAALLWRYDAGPRTRWLWTGAAAYLAFLTLNKQLDLQSLLTQTGRCLARAEGWYKDRGEAQLLALWVVLYGLGLGLWLGLRLAARGDARLMLGLALITGFVASRALSLHDLDRIFAQPLFGLALHRYIEAAALFLLLWAGLTRRVPLGPRFDPAPRPLRKRAL